MFSDFDISSARKNQQAASEEASCISHIHFLAVWYDWLKKADAKKTEQRDIAVDRMMRCLEDEAKPLDLRDLALSSLPSLLPPNGKLTISEALLPGLFNHMLNNNLDERLLTDFVDNFICFKAHCDGKLLPYGYHHWQLSREGVSAPLIAVRGTDNPVRQGLINYIKLNELAGLSEIESALHALIKETYFSPVAAYHHHVHDEKVA